MATPMKKLMLEQGRNPLLTLAQNARQIPCNNNQDWIELRTGNYALVDKSLFVQSILTQGPQLTLIIRPPKWGKTVAASMLRHFFNCPISCGNEQQQHQKRQRNYELFFSQKSPLLINQHRPFVEPHFMKYIVLVFSLKNFNGSTPNSLKKDLSKIIEELYKQHQYLSSTEFGSKYHKNIQKNNSHQKIEWPLFLIQSLCQLIEILSQYHKKEFVIIFDDYDTPILAEKYSNQEDKLTIQKIICSFIISLNKFEVFRLIALGITNLFEDDRIEKQFYQCNTIYYPSLCRHLNFGFTKEQVNSLIVSVFRNKTKEQRLNVWLLIKVIEVLYGGYTTIIKDINYKSKEIIAFNPYSVLQYLKDCSQKQKIQYPQELLHSWPKQAKYHLQSMQRYFKKVQNKKKPSIIELYSLILRQSAPNFGHPYWIDFHKNTDNFEDKLAVNIYNMIQLGILTQKDHCYAIPNQEIWFFFKSQLTQLMEIKIKQIVDSFHIDLRKINKSGDEILNLCHKIFNDFIRSFHSQDVLCPQAQRDLLITIINFLQSNRYYKSLKQHQSIVYSPPLVLIPLKRDFIGRYEDYDKTIIIYSTYSVSENDDRIKKRDQAYLQFLQRKCLRIVAANELSKDLKWKRIILRMVSITKIMYSYQLELQQTKFSREQVQKIIYCSQICFKVQKYIQSLQNLQTNIKKIKQFSMCHNFETIYDLLNNFKNITPQKMIEQNQKIQMQLQQDLKKKKKRSSSQFEAKPLLVLSQCWIQILREHMLANRSIAMLIEDDLIPYFPNQNDRYAIIGQIQSAYDKVSRKKDQEQLRAIIEQYPSQKLIQWVFNKLNSYKLQVQLTQLVDIISKTT